MGLIISEEQAEKEVISWLNYRNVSQRKRDSLAGNIKTLSHAIMDGVLVLKEDFSFEQKLNNPLPGDIKTLIYKPRLTMEEAQTKLAGVRPGDMLGTSFAYIAALTNQPTVIIKKIESEDYTIADQLSFFFMA